MATLRSANNGSRNVPLADSLASSNLLLESSSEADATETLWAKCSVGRRRRLLGDRDKGLRGSMSNTQKNEVDTSDDA